MRSARAFLYEITDQAFDLLRADEALDVATCSLLRLAATNAAHVSAEVTQTVYRLSGTAGITTGSPVARHMQDAMIVPQHAFLADSIWQNAGKILLGMETTPGFP